MANTPNLGLYKPHRDDSIDVDTSLAQNFETIDTEVKGTKNRLDAVEAELVELGASQTEASQKAQTAIDTADGAIARLTIAEADIEEIKTSGVVGSNKFVDGGSFLDTYASQESGLDGGEF